jgi:hypothetical protein
MSGSRLGTTLFALTARRWKEGTGISTVPSSPPGRRRAIAAAAPCTDAEDASFHARRLLAVLECRPSDDAVRARAVELASRSGGYLTLLVLVPRPFPCLGMSPYCVPRVSADELREQAAAALARAAALVPADIPLLTALEEGKPSDAVRRRILTAAHDAVVVRRRLRLGRAQPVPVVTC